MRDHSPLVRDPRASSLHAGGTDRCPTRTNESLWIPGKWRGVNPEELSNGALALGTALNPVPLAFVNFESPPFLRPFDAFQQRRFLKSRKKIQGLSLPVPLEACMTTSWFDRNLVESPCRHIALFLIPTGGKRGLVEFRTR
jgi:hypothetical protein